MLVLATDDFEVYHEVVRELRGRSVSFTTVDPADPIPDDATAVIVGPRDAPEIPSGIPRIVADPGEGRTAVADALAAIRGERTRRVVGVDPGERPGIAVLEGETIVAAFQVPAADTADRITDELEGAVDPIVRIGDGARLIGARIIRELEDVTVELVDETGTTPYLGPGARGMGDVLAAVNIARLEGEPLDSRDIEPTAGELTRIKERSRERSAENRAITEQLARAVATGKLTLDEALGEHGTEE